MIHTYYKREEYLAEQFHGEEKLIEKYHLKSKRLKDQTIAFYQGQRRVHLGDWFVRKTSSRKRPEIYDNYAFQMEFNQGL